MTDFPSAGDTSSSGAGLSGEDLLISYCAGDISRDSPWILGMVAPSSIRIARVNLPSLQALAARSGAPMP